MPAAAANRPTPAIELLTISETAVVLRVSAMTVRRLITNGKMRCVHIEGRRLIRRSDLEQYVNSVVV